MNLDGMNRDALRAECKSKGVKGYSRMTVPQMREALIATAAPAQRTPLESVQSFNRSREAERRTRSPHYRRMIQV